jgi:hypothetical protein
MVADWGPFFWGGVKMSSLLERIKDGSEKFTAIEMLEEEITRIISSLYSFQVFLPEEEQRNFIKEMRDDCVRLRYAVSALAKGGKKDGHRSA